MTLTAVHQTTATMTAQHVTVVTLTATVGRFISADMTGRPIGLLLALTYA